MGRRENRQERRRAEKNMNPGPSRQWSGKGVRAVQKSREGSERYEKELATSQSEIVLKWAPSTEIWAPAGLPQGEIGRFHKKVAIFKN
jgi:hypothetical protein